jgi:hypothetical protein
MLNKMLQIVGIMNIMRILIYIKFIKKCMHVKCGLMVFKTHLEMCSFHMKHVEIVRYLKQFAIMMCWSKL